MVKRPKRRRSKDNPYILECDSNKCIYTVSFKDSNKNIQTIEINELIYKELDNFELEDLSQMNKYDKHIEHSELYEETLYKRAMEKTISLEIIVEKRIILDELRKHIFELPDIQRRRLIKYFFEEKTFEKIAIEENCTKRAIKFSVDIAIKKISEKMKK